MLTKEQATQAIRSKLIELYMREAQSALVEHDLDSMQVWIEQADRVSGVGNYEDARAELLEWFYRSEPDFEQAMNVTLSMLVVNQ